MPREDHISVVGFALEPAAERRKWFGRVVLLIVVCALAWVTWTRVINTDDQNPRVPSPVETSLPGPI